MCTLILENKLHLAPLGKTIQKVLDIGTGTGIWAIDFADEYPSASVIGTDISPIQPRVCNKSPLRPAQCKCAIELTLKSSGYHRTSNSKSMMLNSSGRLPKTTSIVVN